MRNIEYIFVHCTDTPPSASLAGIRAHWRALGWRNPGYHVLVQADGTSVKLQPLHRVANGAAGYNQRSVHVAYVGGRDARGRIADTRTGAQRAALIHLLSEFKLLFPEAAIRSHRDVNPLKACPAFDATAEYASI